MWKLNVPEFGAIFFWVSLWVVALNKGSDGPSNLFAV